MKEIKIIELYDLDYSVKVINTFKQDWQKQSSFNCIGAPKQTDMLLYLDGCKAVYTLKDGKKIHAENGSVIYVPVNSEYEIKLYDFEDKISKTVHINFLLYASDNTPFVLGKDIIVFSADNINYGEYFYKMNLYGETFTPCYSKIKSIVYDILFRLSEFYRKSYCNNKFGVIEKGIQYLEQDERQELSVAQISKMCNVSEVYFRKLFKEYSGVSPSVYRTSAKIQRAKNYLKYEQLSIAEISDLLNFSDVSYFIKVFKEFTLLTPKEYRNNFRASNH